VIDDCFSAGNRVAFHVTQTGSYVGGRELDAPADSIGKQVSLYSAGVLRRDARGELTGRIIRERAGLQRQLGQ
jgi:hypothetical protein